MASNQDCLMSPTSKGFHVHFTEESDTFSDHSEIVVQPHSDVKFDVHLGFLQINHHYEICFTVKQDLGRVRQKISDPPNLNLQILDITSKGSLTDIKARLFAHKEKLLKELLILEDESDPSKIFTLVLTARVLGAGKGTPLLKSGIRCTGFEIDEESEASDWQGFE